jgi:hypothetical protein
MVAKRLGELQHEAKVKVFEGENEASSRSLISAIRTAKGPKPSPISARTRSKGKRTKKRVLDLHSQTSEDSDHPMTADEPDVPLPPSPAPIFDTPSPAEPTPKATVFHRPETPPPLSRPSSSTPTGPPRLTPPTEPASELTMVLAALDGLKSSLSAEIQKVNSRVDQLILYPTDLVPSSQPYEDFGDFALPTSEEVKDAAASSTFHTLDDDIQLEGLYFELASILQSSGKCLPFTETDHEIFGDFLARFLRELHWELTPSSYTEDQLNHIASLWNARSTEERALTKKYLDRDLFDDLYGASIPRSETELQTFSDHIDRFCAHYKKSRPLRDSDFVFIKEFITRDPTPPSQPVPDPRPPRSARVRFSEPPITTINTPTSPSTLTPASAAPTPGPEEFPALAGKPFGDTWSTVTSRRKKKKASDSPSPPRPGPAPTPNPPVSFAAVASANPPPSTAKSGPKALVVKPKVPDALRTLRYSIILNHSRPDIREMLGVDANRIFRTIRADLEKVNAPLTLLAGHWSSAVINKNFILTFAGLQTRDDIAKYDAIFFRPFGSDCRGAPTAGYRTVLLGGVPLVRDSAGRLPTPHELDKEIGRNAAFKGVLSLAPPRWLYNPNNIDPARRVSSVIIAFYDPNGKVFDLITKSRTAVAMFGSFVTARPFENRPSFSQCSRCLRLGHSVERCNRPSSLVVCPSCGGPHKAHEHAFRCPSSKSHRGRQCSCPPRCFLCIERKHKLKGEGHNALSHSCPLRALYRAVAADPAPSPHRLSDSDGNIPIPDAPRSSADTIPPTPGADGPFTLVPADKCEALVALHNQGASTDELCRSVLSSKDIADLSTLSQ